MRDSQRFTSKRLKMHGSPTVFAQLRSHFLAGIFTLLPLSLSILVVVVLLRYLHPLAGQIIKLFEGSLPGFIVNYPVVYSFLILSFFALAVGVGVLSKWVIGKQLIKLGDFLLGRIPIVGWFYETVKQVVAAFNTGKSAFKAVVLIRYPHPESWALAFLTNESPDEFAACVNQDLVAVFMPTTPNPTSGFLMYVPRKDVRKTGLSVDHAFKLIISTGMLSLDELDEVNGICKENKDLPGGNNE